MLMMPIKRLFNNLFPRIKPISIDECKNIYTSAIFDKQTFYMPAMHDISMQYHEDIFSYSVDVPSYNIYSIRNGKCIVGKEEIYTKNNRVIKEITSQKTNPKIGLSSRFLRNYEHIRGKVLCLSQTGLVNNYYHFNVEFLGRFYIFVKSNLEYDYITFPENNKFQREFRTLLGVDKNKILDERKYNVIRADELIFTDLLNNWRPEDFRGYSLPCKEYVPSWLIGIYKYIKKRNKMQGRNYQRLYISRSKAEYRRVVNEDKLLEVLHRYGFHSLYLEELTVTEQIEIFSSAELIIAPHGAGLVNISYCNKKASILELYPQFYHDPGIRIQATMLGHDYQFHVGKSDTINNVNPRNEDVVVDVERIEKWLIERCLTTAST